ncbi:hypothetical protein GQL56_27715, partial [Pseudomonas putida]|nr:hypothetical protein [Pseudomonas putida]
MHASHYRQHIRSEALMASTTPTVHHPFGMDPCDQQNHPIFNATTQKCNAVDPRTGLFEAYVPLPSITGNNGDGPVVDMSLFYSPLVNNHAGLGDGWSFAFTCYREEQKQLTLHSGEVLSVSKGEEAEVHKVKVRWANNDTVLRLRHPGGRSEMLEQVGTSKVWMATSISSGHGSVVYMTWEQIKLESSVKEDYEKLLVSDVEKKMLSQSYIRLTQIRDRHRTLVQLTYTDAAVTLVFWPDAEGESLTYTLNLSDYALENITAPDSSMCSMAYLDHPQCGRLLQKLTTFEGVQESVSYADNGLIFQDNAKLSALPCVNKHTLTPRGASVKPIETTYGYKRIAKSDGEYCTTVEQAGGVAQTDYFYDKSHELIKETTLDGKCTVTRNYSNEIESDSFWREISTTYSNKEGVERSVGCRSYFYQDELHETAQSAGKAEYNMHCFAYAAEGDKLSGRFTQAANEWTKFNDGAEVEGIRSGDYSSEAVYANSHKVPAWFKYDLKDPFTHLLLVRAVKLNFAGGSAVELREVRLRRKIESDTDWIIKQGYLSVDSTWIITSQKFVGVDTIDGVRSVQTQEQRGPYLRATVADTSVFSGRLVKQTDADQNTTTYDYDAHGRLTTLTVCAQSDTYKQTTTYSYPSTGRLEIT